MSWPPDLEVRATGCFVAPCGAPGCPRVAEGGDARNPLLLADGRVLVFCSRRCLAAWALDHEATRGGGFGRAAATWLRRYDERRWAA